MSTYVVNHLRIPGGVPNEAGLSYLEQAEDTAKPFGGRWLAQGEVTVVEGAWPGTIVLMEFPSSADVMEVVPLAGVPAHSSSRRQRDQ